MTIQELLDFGTNKLKGNKIESSNLKSKMLLMFVLNQTKEYLIANSKEQVSEELEKAYTRYLQQLEDGKPIQYITNVQEFFKLNFFVNEDVLIPRQDTEILVEEVLRISKEKSKILDLCTGSGAIAVALAKNIAEANTTATDINKRSLEVAKINAKNNNVNIQFLYSDLFESIKDNDFDIIISNPPYIETDEIENLSREVRNEPKIALDGGIDGLDFYKKIAEKAYDYLKKDGYLCLEIGYNQKRSVIDILNSTKMYYNISVKQDLAGLDRVVVAQYGKKRCLPR